MDELDEDREEGDALVDDDEEADELIDEMAESLLFELPAAAAMAAAMAANEPDWAAFCKEAIELFGC